MEGRDIVIKSREALARTELAFSKVQSIGKIGSERCAELVTKIKVFESNFDSMREEVGAAKAIVSGNSNDVSATGQLNSIMQSSVEEALQLEHSAETHLKIAVDANKEFQQLRKTVQGLTAEVWDQLVNAAKVVAEADKYMSRGEDEFRDGDIKKSSKYMEKAVQKAEKALYSSEKTQAMLDHIMNMLKQGRSSLHLAEANRSSGEVKLNQAKSLAFTVIDTIGVHTPHQGSEGGRSGHNRVKDEPSMSFKARQMLECDDEADYSSNGELTHKNLSELSRNNTNVMKPAAMGPSTVQYHKRSESKSEWENDVSNNPLMSSRTFISLSSGGGEVGSGIDLQGEGEGDTDDQFDLLKEEEMLIMMRETWLKDEALLAEISKQRQTIEESLRGNEAELSSIGSDGSSNKNMSSSQSSGGSSGGSSGWKEGRKRDKIEGRSAALKNMLASLRTRELETQAKVDRHKEDHRTRFINRPREQQQVSLQQLKLTRPHSKASHSSSEALPYSQTQDASSHAHHSHRQDHRQGKNSYEFTPAEKMKLAGYYFSLATDFEDRDMLEEAVNAYEYSLSHFSEQPECHYNLAILLDTLGRLDESVVASRAAIKLRPQWAEAHYNLGQTFDSIGDLGKAVVCYENAVRYNSKWEDAIHNLAAAKQELQLSNLSIPTSGVYENTINEDESEGGLIANIQAMKLKASSSHSALGHGQDASMIGEEQWDVESATSHSTVDSNHSDNSFWSAHSHVSHVSKASGKLSQSGLTSHSSRNNMQTLETLNATPPKKKSSSSSKKKKKKSRDHSNSNSHLNYDCSSDSSDDSGIHSGGEYGGRDGYAASVSTTESSFIGDNTSSASSEDILSSKVNRKLFDHQQIKSVSNVSSDSASSSHPSKIKQQQRRKYPEFSVDPEKSSNKLSDASAKDEDGDGKDGKCHLM